MSTKNLLSKPKMKTLAPFGIGDVIKHPVYGEFTVISQTIKNFQLKSGNKFIEIPKYNLAHLVHNPDCLDLTLSSRIIQLYALD